MRHLHLHEIHDPLTLQVSQTRRNVTLVRRARQRRKAALTPAIADEIGQFLSHSLLLWQPSGPR